MTVDTRNGIIAVIAAGAMALVIVGSLLGIIVLAVAHDGSLSASAMDTFKQILTWAIGGGALLGIVERVTASITAGKAITAGASVQGSPVTVTQADPPSDLAGAAAADVPGEGL